MLRVHAILKPYMINGVGVGRQQKKKKTPFPLHPSRLCLPLPRLTPQASVSSSLQPLNLALFSGLLSLFDWLSFLHCSPFFLDGEGGRNSELTKKGKLYRKHPRNDSQCIWSNKRRIKPLPEKNPVLCKKQKSTFLFAGLCNCAMNIFLWNTQIIFIKPGSRWVSFDSTNWIVNGVSVKSNETNQFNVLSTLVYFWWFKNVNRP